MKSKELEIAQVLTYRYRLLPNKRQHANLCAILEAQRQLYNAALEERINAWKKSGKSISCFDQFKSLTQCRRDIPEMAALPVRIQRGTIKRLDLAFVGFFRRLKRGDKPGFPRFKGRNWFKSFEFSEFCGIRFDGKRLRFKGMPGGLRVHLHRSMPNGKILSAKFKRDTKGWVVCLAVNVETPPKKTVSKPVGIDVGIKSLAHLSDGVVIPDPRAARKAEKEMRRRLRQLARCKRGSSRRKKIKVTLARLHTKITNTRQTALHQASAMLIKAYDLIAVEDLNVKGLSKGILAREVHDASWTKLIEFIEYKAERAGVHFVKVDPKYTSQDCSGCGTRVKKSLSVRTHSCPECGLVLDRDHNAALNILNKAVVGLGLVNVAGCSERSTGKLSLVSN